MIKLKTLLAAPIPLEVELPEGQSVTLNFKRVTLSIREKLIRQYGEKKLQESFKELDFALIVDILYSLIINKDDLIKFSDYIGETNKEHIFKGLFTSESYLDIVNIFLQCLGISEEDQKNFESLDEDKKKVIVDSIENPTTHS